MEKIYLSEIKNFFLKITNKSKYNERRNILKLQKKIDNIDYDFLAEVDKISKNIESKNDLTFKHSGHLGDLFYALPLIKELSKTHQCTLLINTEVEYDGYYHKHPAGKLMISKKLYEMAYPLLNSQEYLYKVEKLEDKHQVDIDLDLFRKLPATKCFHSVRWYFQLVGLQADLALPYFNVEPHSTIKDKVVVVKTERAANPFTNYQFLKNYSDILFLGTKKEYDVFVKSVPNAAFYDAKDFLELAQIIKASRFYVSNQTMAYAIAEGLKVPRILEAYPDFPVIFPIGGKGKDVYFQNHFEQTFKQFYEANN